MFKPALGVLLLLFMSPIQAKSPAANIPCPTTQAIINEGVTFTYYDSVSYTWWFENTSFYNTPYEWHFTLFVSGNDLAEATLNAWHDIQTVRLVSSYHFPKLYSCTYQTQIRLTGATAVANDVS